MFPPTTDLAESLSAPDLAEEHLALEFSRIIAVNLHEMDETQINAFVELGESMGLPRERALEIVATLINQHIEDAEAQGMEILWESEEMDLVDHIDAAPDLEHVTDETLSCEKPESEAAPVILEAPAPAPARTPTAPPPLAPVAHAADTPPPRPTRIVRLGRQPILERGTQAAAAERAAFPDFTNPIEMEMRLISSGSFLMGCDDTDAPKNEKPCTLATMSCFYMSRFPVTNVQYEQFDPNHRNKRLPNTGDHHPVVFVTSLEAAKFCEWLGRKDKGRRYRLPTEAEWEYAARGTTGRRFPWGNEDGISTVANFADARSRLAWRNEELDDGFPDTSPVGSFPDGMSPFKIEDMAGNVWEWCVDFYDAYRAVQRTNPRGPAFGVNRVIRGGSYKSRYTSLRATARGFSLPTCAANDIGFRVVCDAA